MSLIPIDVEVDLEGAKASGLLHLSFLQLMSVPASVFDVASLVRLDLGHNELTALPAAIGNLTRSVVRPLPLELWVASVWIRMLLVEETAAAASQECYPCLTATPAYIALRAHCRRLEELWLNDNPLRSLPPEIQKCLSLRHLQLQVRAGCTLRCAQGWTAALFAAATACVDKIQMKLSICFFPLPIGRPRPQPALCDRAACSVLNG